MRKKRTTLQPFSLSFLDCICCGFGSVILLFVLTSGRKAESRQSELSDVNIDLGALKNELEEVKDEHLKINSKNDSLSELLAKIKAKKQTIALSLEDKNKALQLALKDQASLDESLKKLLDKLEHMPKTEEPPAIPFPNPVKRQYMTDFKLDGNRVLILLEASGGMLDLDVDSVIDRLSDDDVKKREAPKWKRAVKATEWLISSLHSSSRYQVMVFNKNAKTILSESNPEWLDLKDRKTTTNVIDALNNLVPQGGANLERAFNTIHSMSERPDNIILITDGLPTLSDSVESGSTIDEARRIRMYSVAKKRILNRVPINIILFPMSGDPSAAALYWVLATKTKGSFICPSKNWPET